MTSWSEEDQNLYLFGITLATMAAYTIINLSYFKYISTYNKLLSLFDIKSIRKLSSSKYVLKRKNWFFIDKRLKKRKLSTETNDIVIE